jgi:hypothetical protein
MAVGGTIQGNIIGAGTSGEALGNGSTGSGILLYAAPFLIGGEASGAANTIAHNSLGIHVVVSVEGGEIRRNSIHSNSNNSIDGDGIYGPTLSPAPILTALSPIAGTSEAGSIIDIFADDDDEGETYLDSVVAEGNGDFSSSVDLSSYTGKHIRATATNTSDSTSVFSDSLVAGAPVITTDPVSQTVDLASSVTFTVVASGDSLTYQWQKDSVDIPGATSDSFQIASAQESDEGDYSCVVSNGAGSVESLAATLTVNPESSSISVEFGVGGLHDGTSENPFATIADALPSASLSNPIVIKAGETDETLTIQQEAILMADGGTVRIGVMFALIRNRMTSVKTVGTQSEADSTASSGSGDSGNLGIAGEPSAERAFFEEAIFESFIPLSSGDTGERVAGIDGKLAIRLRDFDGLDLASLWAEIHPEGSGGTADFEWKPIVDGDDRDIWILISPGDTWIADALLSATAGGIGRDKNNVLGNVVSVLVEPFETPDSAIVQQPGVDDADSGIGRGATVTIVAVSSQYLDGTLAYQIGPDEVFDVPRRVWLAVPTGIAVDDVTLRYYKSSTPHSGWHDAANIEGFLADSEVVSYDDESGQTWLGFAVNHAGIVALD